MKAPQSCPFPEAPAPSVRAQRSPADKDEQLGRNRVRPPREATCPGRQVQPGGRDEQNSSRSVHRHEGLRSSGDGKIRASSQGSPNEGVNMTQGQCQRKGQRRGSACWRLPEGPGLQSALPTCSVQKGPHPPQRDVTLTWHNPFCCFAPLKSGTCVNQAGGTDAGHLRGCPVLVLRPVAAAQGLTPVSAGQGQGVN